MMCPFDSDPDSPENVAKRETNPDGWTITQKEGEDNYVIKGQNAKGDIFEAKTSVAFNETTLKSFVIIKDNSKGVVSFWDADYKWTNKDEMADQMFFRDKMGSLSFWAIDRKIPKEFVRAVWRRMRPLFWRAASRASVFALQLRSERENAKSGGSQDLFSGK
jgi:hypothetical protein